MTVAHNFLEMSHLSSDSSELKSAAFNGDLSRVRSLLSAGANPDSADESGAGTLLTFHPSITACLLEAGANPDKQTNENGASVLAGLCYVNQIDCVRLILEHGADPNLGRMDTLETPLHHALANDASEDLIKLLIKHGADVNARTLPGIRSYHYYGETPTRGESPLHRAAAYGSLGTIKLLLEAGADRSLTDINDNLPCHWAGWHRRPKEIVQLVEPGE